MDSYERYYNSALKYLGMRPRSEKEVRDNLTKKKSPPDVIERVIAKLTEQKFLNDEEFTRWWIEQRTRVTPRSMRLIRLELMQKGISKEIIESAISNQQSVVGDKETARRIIEKRIDKMKGLKREEVYQKLGGYLARKGYNWDIIKNTIDELWRG
jgi:regulatory protein